MNENNKTFSCGWFYPNMQDWKQQESKNVFKFHTAGVKQLFTKTSFFAALHEDNVVNLFSVVGNLGIPHYSKKIILSNNNKVTGFACNKAETHLLIFSQYVK
jgi:hypothetical protein